MNKLNYFKQSKYILLAMFITSVILLITFILNGIYPFGESSILKIDLYHQYAPFHAELREKLLTGDSFFYSWKGGLGKDFFSQMAYYTASPLNFLIVFFPLENLPEAILIFISLKIIACSGFFAYYLKNRFKTNNLSIVIFAIMYAFMSFVTSFYWNIMWLDSIALFPVIILGVEKLVKSGSYKVYVFALALSIFVNFYIAFLVCIFTTLYFLIQVFSKYKVKKDFKVILNRFIKFGIFSLIAGGLTMVLSIPTAMAIIRTSTSNTQFPNFEIYSNIFQLISSHFLGAVPVVLSGSSDLPNAYCGVLTMVLLPTYFASKNVKLKEKVLHSILIIFMLLCVIIKPFAYLIHGGHFPAGLPHRFTFIYCFILLTLSFKAFKNIKNINLKVLIGFSLFFAIAISTIEIFGVKFLIQTLDIYQTLSKQDIIANIILIIIYNIILILYKNYSKSNINFQNKTKIFVTSAIGCIALLASIILIFGYWKISLNSLAGFITIALILLTIIIFSYSIYSKVKVKSIILVILLVIVSGEVTFNILNGFNAVGTINREGYIKYIDGTKEALNFIKNNDTEENKFYRMEFNRFSPINEGSLYGYNGFSQFSSLAYGDTTNLLKKLGIASTNNSYRYYDPTPLINAMFNIKYVLTKDNSTINTSEFEFIDNFDNVSLMKNLYYLSLGFMVNNDIKNWDIEQNSPFDVQNEFIKKATNITNNILNAIEFKNFEFENITITKNNEDNTSFSYKLIDPDDTNNIPEVKATILNEKTQRLFIYINSPNSRKFKYIVTSSNKSYERNLSTGSSFIDLGIVEEGDEIKISFYLNKISAGKSKFASSGSFKIFVASFDEDIFEKAYCELNDEILIVQNYTSDFIQSKINVLNDGILFTSIPYDKAWEVFVDGKKVETLKIAGDGLIGLNLTAGEHKVIFKYRTTGFKLGVFLSLISLIVLTFYIIYEFKKGLYK